MKHSVTIRQFNDFRIVWAFEQKSADLRRALINFWLHNGAIADPNEAWRRTFEVGCIAWNKADEIVGVSSFYADRLIHDGHVYWHYRTFVRPDCRLPGLAPQVFQMTFDALSELHAAEPFSPIGIVVVVENPKLEKPSGFRVIERCGMERLGDDQHGKSIWRRCFEPVAMQSGQIQV